MTKMNLDTIVGEDRFWSIRGKAIDAYAILEQSLCLLFAHLAGMPLDIAGIVFFKITSARSRSAVLEELLKKRYGAKYNAFWNRYFRDLGQIDRGRNEIVHWLVVETIDTADPTNRIVTLSLMPRKLLVTDASPKIETSDLMTFIGKCDVFARACSVFTSPLREVGPWPDIFQQPLAYPLPYGHPLTRKLKTLPDGAESGEVDPQ
jgi:hypothetical protein